MCSLICSLEMYFSQKRHFVWFSLRTYSTIFLLKVPGDYILEWNRLLCFLMDLENIILLQSGHCILKSLVIFLLFLIQLCDFIRCFKNSFLHPVHFSISPSLWWEIVQFSALISNFGSLFRTWSSVSSSLWILNETIALGEIRIPGASYGLVSTIW